MSADQERVRKTLEHFNISQNDLSNAIPFWEIENNTHTRDAYGINRIMQGEKSKKVRIIIDYDADFPEMIIRIFSKCSQKEELEGKDRYHAS